MSLLESLDFNFGERLKCLRERAIKNQRDIAELLNISQQTVSNWERNIGQPDYGQLIKIADFLNITVDRIIGRPDDPYSIKNIKAISFDDSLIDISSLSHDMQQLVKAMVEDARQNKIKKS